MLFGKNLGDAHPRAVCAAKTASDMACLLNQAEQH